MRGFTECYKMPLEISVLMRGLVKVPLLRERLSSLVCSFYRLSSENNAFPSSDIVCMAPAFVFTCSKLRLGSVFTLPTSFPISCLTCSNSLSNFLVDVFFVKFVFCSKSTWSSLTFIRMNFGTYSKGRLRVAYLWAGDRDFIKSFLRRSSVTVWVRTASN